MSVRSMEDEEGIVVSNPASPTVTAEKGEDTDVSSDDDDDEELSLKKRFDHITSSLGDSNLKDGAGDELRDPVKLEAFAQGAAWLGEKTGDGDHTTLLHLLADAARDKVFDKYQPIISLLLRRFPQLLREKDGNEKTPLYIAISKKREKVVRLMCTTEKDIDSVFRISCYSSTCLHLSIKRSIPHNLMIYLIGLASKETLCSKDDAGNTPLHLAVHYERCVDTQLEIVKTLVERCDDAMDERNNAPNWFSPYQFHESTRIATLRKIEIDLRAKELEAVQVADVSAKQRANPKMAAKVDPKIIAGPKEQVPQGGSAAALEAKSDKMFFMPKRSNTGAEALIDKGPMVPSPGRAEGASSVTEKPAAKEAGKKRTRPKQKDEIKVSEESALAIKNFLKLHCLRTMNDDDAVDFLYGRKKENEIYFDLYTTPHLTISEERMREGFAHLQFEDVLQYVALPTLHVERIPVQTKFSSNKKPQIPESRGRTDMEFIFNFLRAKAVQRVIRVIVDDTPEPSHSDESIEVCLGGLNVEIWDWAKTDLCAETIRTAAPEVKEVSLYWSGNNAVLRSWSESDGLNKLLRLQKIRLHVKQGLETAVRTLKNIESFIARFKILRPDVKVKVIKEDQVIKHDPGATVDPAHPQAEPGHKWLATMDDFSYFIQGVKPSLSIEEPVTIALIDDGVDVSERSLHAKVIGGRSFCQRDREENLSTPYYVSTGGHGTIMASLICRVCPNAQLYVVKLEEGVVENQKRQIKARSAEKAVRAAIAEGVHIISMSWTIERTAQNATEIAGLENAIELAAKSGILMFCAANDQGIARDHSFPSASSTKHIFKIGAAEASGVIWKWTGDAADVDFIFPGHNVIKERQNEAPHERCKTLTGSSVATAIASGLAALILYCVQLGALNTQALKLGGGATTMEDFRAIKGHERMRDAMLSIGTSSTSGNKYIEVWDMFGEAVKTAEGASTQRKMEIVAEIAGRLKTTKKFNQGGL